jgi:hypothetical protein
LSSTILYLAIVAIWAGVLVPRWLRREPHHETSSHSQDAAAEGGESGMPAASGIPTSAAENERRPERGGGPGWAERSGRARVMATRRRLFGILVTLAVAATTIAVAGLATWWVAAPPVGMLAGYVLLLREAARADAELVARGTASAADHDDRAGRAGHRQVDARPVPGAAVPGTGRVSSTVAGPEAAALAAAEASETAEVVDLMSRVEEELYDQYADAKLRAVGD